MDRTYDPPLCAAAMQTPPLAAAPMLAFLGVPNSQIQNGGSIGDACGGTSVKRNFCSKVTREGKCGHLGEKQKS